MGQKKRAKTKHSRRAAIEQATREVTRATNFQAAEATLAASEVAVSKGKGLTTLRAQGLIILIGIVTFAWNLRNKFQGDDYNQLLNNPVIHSVSHVSQFFQGGAFYYGAGIAPLSGSYFRPLMITLFSLFYTLFGANAVYYHLFQTMLFIASVCILFLVLKKPFNTTLALLLAMLFLVHPLNTQVVYSIPNLQDTLLFFFGILGFYVLTTYSSIRSLFVVGLSLFLSLLAKETSLCFIIMCAVYLFYWDKKRLYTFLAILAAPVIAYAALRTNAIGGLQPHFKIVPSPIQGLNIWDRLLTIPEIVLFYVWNFIFPWHIASQYLWTIKHYSTARVLIPTIVDLLLIAFIADRSLELKKRAGEDGFRMFVFFAIWTGIGLIPYLQIVSIDGTVNDAWFVVSMIGVIGMLGAYLTAYQVKMQYILIAGTALVLVFGVRSALRASDWKNSYILAQADVPVAASDYTGWSSLAVYYSNQHHYALAAAKYKQALQIQPYYLADYNLGVDESLAGQFALAEGAYAKATKLSPPKEAYEKIDENACLTASFTGTKYEDVAVCQLALNRFPKDPTLWIYLAFVEQRFGDNSVAKNYLATAQKYGVVPKIWVTEITKDEPITINFLFSGEDKTIYPQSV